MGIYNCEKSLSEAIESIINQTYENWELIMCEDGSGDDTYRVAEKYAAKYPDKIILLRNERNYHLAYSLNRCLEYATGEFIARMDGDDISAPDRFQKQVDFLQSHPEYDLVGCAMRRFSAEGLANEVYPVKKPDYYTMRKDNPFFHATIMAKKIVFETLCGYTVEKRTERSEDSDLWFRFYKAGLKGANMQEVLYYVREDAAAIRRRTFKSRWRSFQTTRYGFELLDYPRWWIIRQAVITAFKSIVPYRLIEIYQWVQKKSKKIQYNAKKGER